MKKITPPRYFQLLNSSVDTDQTDWGPSHFWPDSSAKVQSDEKTLNDKVEENLEGVAHVRGGRAGERGGAPLGLRSMQLTSSGELNAHQSTFVMIGVFINIMIFFEPLDIYR